MRDKPFGAALLDVAREALTREVVPGLTGRQRYVALMVANAIGIASREIEQADEVARAWDRALPRLERRGGSIEASASRLVAAIRRGEHDADPGLHAALLETALVGAAIWKPALAQEARRSGDSGDPVQEPDDSGRRERPPYP